MENKHFVVKIILGASTFEATAFSIHAAYDLVCSARNALAGGSNIDRDDVLRHLVLMENGSELHVEYSVGVRISIHDGGEWRC